MGTARWFAQGLLNLCFDLVEKHCMGEEELGVCSPPPHMQVRGSWAETLEKKIIYKKDFFKEHTHMRTFFYLPQSMQMRNWEQKSAVDFFFF